MYEYESIWCRKKVKYMWHIHSRHITSTMVDQGAKVALEKHGRIEASARSSTPFGLVKVILVKCEEMGTLGSRKTSKNHGFFIFFHIKLASWQLDTNGLSSLLCHPDIDVKTVKLASGIRMEPCENLSPSSTVEQKDLPFSWRWFQTSK